jgi:hypothetical protein
MPTEQAENGSLAPTSDIYAVGALLFFMAAGEAPPPPDRRPKKEGDSLFPGHFVDHPELPEDLARVIATALQANPQDRYGSAAEMEEALRGTEAGKSIKKELPLAYIGLFGIIVVAAVLAWVLASGKVGQIQIPFLSGAGNNNAAVVPTPEPAALVPTAVPQMLGRAIINGIDSRRFPDNTVYFSALDTNGLPMPNFGMNSFQLKENGSDVKSVQLTELRRTSDAISVIVALDNSSGMTQKQMDDAKTAVHILADHLQPGDRMALLTFGGSATAVMSYTVSKAAFLSAVDPQKPQGPPMLADAIGKAAEIVRTQPQAGYSAMVVVSNGAFLKGRVDVGGMVDAANSANLPVFFVGLDKETFPEAANQLSAGTGGVAMAAETPDAGGAGEAVKRVEKLLHNVYKLSYESATNDPDSAHQLELTLNWGGVFQTHTRGYSTWPPPVSGTIFGPGPGAPDPNKDP